MKIDLGQAPLLIGITGHRDISESDSEVLRLQLDRIFKTYSESLPDTKIYLITGLAEGADRIAVQSALATQNVRIIAALPMRLGQYRKDFDLASNQELDELLAQCHFKFDVSSTIQSPRSVSEELSRDAHYQHFGRWLAKNCHVLIAAWDGKSPELVGGTADNVYYKARLKSILASNIDEGEKEHIDQGVILWCPTTRISDSEHPLPHVGIQVLDEFGNAVPWSKQADAVSQEINIFNRTIHRLPASNSIGKTESSALFQTCDLLASTLQKRYLTVLRVMVSFTILAVASIDAMQTTEINLFIWSLLIFVVLNFSLWGYLNKSRLKEQFQEVRYLAECSRVQTVWQSAQIKFGVADYLTSSQESSRQWIRATLRSSWLLDNINMRTPFEFDVARNWMDEQILYYEGSSSAEGAINRHRRRYRRLVQQATFAFAVAGVALLIDASNIFLGGNASSNVEVLSRLAWALGLGIGISLISYGELIGHKQLARRYSLVAKAFRRGKNNLDQASEVGSHQMAQAVILDIGKYSLEESSSWLATQTERAIRPI